MKSIVAFRCPASFEHDLVQTFFINSILRLNCQERFLTLEAYEKLRQIRSSIFGKIEEKLPTVSNDDYDVQSFGEKTVEAATEASITGQLTSNPDTVGDINTEMER